MIDINKVITGIECCKSWDDSGAFDGYNPDYDKCAECPYSDDNTLACDCHEQLMNDALKLLIFYNESCLPIRCERCTYMVNGKCTVRNGFCKSR